MMNEEYADERAFKKTPIFDELTLPVGLRSEHSTKSGVWGVIRILQGELRYIVLDGTQSTILSTKRPGLIVPEQKHRVELIGPMSMQVEFYHQRPSFDPDATP